MPPSLDAATRTERPSRLPQSLPADLASRAGPVLASTVLPFCLVLYLALKGGGYDVIVRSEVGIAAWWIVLVGALVGLLPVARLGAAPWTAMGLLAALAVWTAIGIGWSESAERSVGELGRITSYLGVMTLAVMVGGRGALRRTVAAVAAAVGIVAALALLSRFQPSLFPPDQMSQFLPSAGRRLSYPVNYWNGLAALIAIGTPLLLWVATAARTIVAQALAASALPAALLAVYLTFSRAGTAATAIAVALLIALHPRRLTLLPPIVAGGCGGAILIAAIRQREALENGLGGSIADRQGDEMLAITLVVCCGVALLTAALAYAERHELIRWPHVPKRVAVTALAAGVVAATIAALAAGLPGAASDAWDDFKATGGAGSGAERLTSISGNGRYQLWEAAVDANASAPLNGIGAGTFEYWWARDGSQGFFVRDAHSLYMEMLAELGVVGLLLVGGFVIVVLITGVGRCLRRRDNHELAALLAAATAGAAAFAVVAASDWVWELAAVAVAFLLLAAVIVGPTGRGETRTTSSAGPRPRTALLAPLALVSLASIAAIAIPMAGAASVRESQAQAEAGALDEAITSARTAQSVQPYAATAKLQEALILELNGDLPDALEAARAATRDEPTNWRTWFVRSRLEAQNGNAHEAVDAYRKARSLNPRSPLFS
jgi:hypothetical protein